MDVENNKSRPNVLITGTPGTGKTTLSKLLGEYVEGMQVINVGQLIVEQKLYREWDNKFDVPVYDEDQVIDALEPVMSAGGVIVDFHSCGFFPERWFDLVVLLRTNNTVLYDRLQARGYAQEKITENIECEILEVVSEEVYTSYKHEIILELVNEETNQMEQNMGRIIEFLRGWKQQQQ